MNTPSYREDHASQIPALQMLINMGYDCIPPSEAMKLRGGKTAQVLFDEVLRTQLKKINRFSRRGESYPFSDSSIEGAIRALRELPLQDGFLNANKALYDLITLGKSFEETVDGDKKSHDIQYIDWENPENNVFQVTEELSVLRTGRTDHFRPDIILYVNGIPLGIIEAKSPALSGEKTPTELAIEQHIRNFSKNGIRELYVYSQILVAIATNEGKYATTGTSKEFWGNWKEWNTSSEEAKAYEQKLSDIKNRPLDESTKNKMFAERNFGFSYTKAYFDALEQETRKVTHQDEMLYALAEPSRLLDLIRNYILYDNGIKKIARYQQYFTVKDTLQRIQYVNTDGQREGGVIWHTQGSGKSLTMVMLAQLIPSLPEIKHPKIVIVTDRIDLDGQIADTFKKCNKTVIQATTGKHLAELLTSDGDAVITTIVNKFEAAVNQLKNPITSSEVFVLVDEAHRSQYETFNAKMQQALPNASYLAFTGTPLIKKSKTENRFGHYIGRPYTVKDAVEDEAVVPLLYEGRHSRITLNEEPLNRHFDRVSEPLSDYGKAKLKRKASTISKINKADQIIYDRAWDISLHYSEFFQTLEDKYKPKAQLVAPSIKTALKYKEYLDQIGKVSSAVVVTRSDDREGNEDGFYETNEDKEREDKYFDAMIDKYGSVESYESNIVNQFKNEDNPEILIVVAKLLTGFDAPKNTVLYLCRSLKEHTLLQAIARVNRVYPGKDYGYIIDYYGNLENLNTAIATYSGLSEAERKDIEDTFIDISKEISKLPQAHSQVWDIFKAMDKKNAESSDFEEVLALKDVRDQFYAQLTSFGKVLKIALSSVEFHRTTAPDKIKKYKQDAKFFYSLRQSAARRYNDEISYKEFEAQMQKLINQHISTDGEVVTITQAFDVFNKEERDQELEKITGKAAKADHIASRTTKAINVRMNEDPVYYKKLAELIKEAIEDYHRKRISEAEYLQKVLDYEAEFFVGNTDKIPEELNGSKTAFAYYNQSKDIFSEPELIAGRFHIEVAQALKQVIEDEIFVGGKKMIDWKNNENIEGEINIKGGDALYELMKKYDLEPDWDKIDLLLANSIKIAKAQY